MTPQEIGFLLETLEIPQFSKHPRSLAKTLSRSKYFKASTTKEAKGPTLRATMHGSCQDHPCRATAALPTTIVWAQAFCRQGGKAKRLVSLAKNCISTHLSPTFIASYPPQWTFERGHTNGEGIAPLEFRVFPCRGAIVSCVPSYYNYLAHSSQMTPWYFKQFSRRVARW